MRNWTETAKQTRIEVALEQAQKQFEYQKNLVMFEAQRDIASASQAAQSKTSAELMSLEQQSASELTIWQVQMVSVSKNISFAF